MITTEIMGGLGNQLFQIFNLISYGLTYNVPFYFEHHDVPRRADRPFYWDNFLSSLKPFVKSTYETNLQIYRENEFHYTEPIPYKQFGKPFKFYGYFQSYKYSKKKNKIYLNLLK